METITEDIRTKIYSSLGEVKVEYYDGKKLMMTMTTGPAGAEEFAAQLLRAAKQARET